MLGDAQRVVAVPGPGSDSETDPNTKGSGSKREHRGGACGNTCEADANAGTSDAYAFDRKADG